MVTVIVVTSKTLPVYIPVKVGPGLSSTSPDMKRRIMRQKKDKISLGVFNCEIVVVPLLVPLVPLHWLLQLVVQSRDCDHWQQFQDPILPLH